jgi:hypothetical protein
MLTVISAAHPGLCVLMHYGHGRSCEAMHACVGVCVWAWSRRMLTVIAARRCMRVPLVAHMIKAHAHGDCCEAMHALCWCVCLSLYKAHAHCDCCEAMHACACLVCSYAQGACSL